MYIYVSYLNYCMQSQRSDFSVPPLLSADPYVGSQAALRDTNHRAIEEHILDLATSISSQSSPEIFASHLVANGFLDLQTMTNKLDMLGDNTYRKVQRLLNVVVTTIEMAGSPEVSTKHFDSFVSIIREELQLEDLAQRLVKRSGEWKNYVLCTSELGCS